MAPIAVGDIIPDGEVTFINKRSRIERASIYSLITNKKVVILGVTGAFVPRSGWRSIPRLYKQADKLKSFGVEEYFCISVNDPFVMKEWGASFKHKKHMIKFLADSTGAYATSLGLFDYDLSAYGCGIRSRKFIFVVEDRKVVIAYTMEAPFPPLLRDISACRSRAPIAVGDIIPDGQVFFLDATRLRKTSIYSIATSKKIMLFGVPGAFETTFSTKYVRAIIEKADVLSSKGIQGIYCISVNDPFVIKGWEERHFRNNGHIKFLADHTATYVKSLGVEADLSSMALGIRSMRFCLVVNDLKVTLASIDKDFGRDVFEYV